MSQRRSGIRIMAKLIGLVKPLSGFMLLAVLLGVIGFLCAISITVLGSAALLAAVREQGDMLRQLFICIAVFAVARGLLHYGEQACNHYIAFKLLALIRDKVFRALRSLAPAKLECRDKGNLVSMITSDIELLEVFYAHTISPICIAVLTSAVMLVFFWSIHPLFAAIALVAYLAVGVAVPLIGSKFVNADGMAYRSGAGAFSGFLLDSMRGLGETIRYQCTGQRAAEIDGVGERMNGLSKRLKIAEGHIAAITDTLILFFSFLMLFAGVLLSRSGAADFSAVLLSTVGMMSSFGPVAALSALTGNLAHTLAAGERVLAILEETPVVPVLTGGKDVRFTGMACRDVSFAYEKEAVLDHFTVPVPQTGILGLTGPSGAGKSTALRLLMRFWDPDSGSITMSGADLKTINTASLRQNQSLVTQETVLFHDTIAANIKIGKADATYEQVVRAAKLAAIHDFILSLPKGYDTDVGELGDLLSDGEKQRIGLARAFLSDAPLMLLDEPTSNLDSLNEGKILQVLDAVRHEKSVVLVSHRPSTKGIADKAYTVYHGRQS